MTRAMRAWRRANACVRKGKHAKALYWLARTQAILESTPPRRKRLDGMDTGYMLVALVVLISLWVLNG